MTLFTSLTTRLRTVLGRRQNPSTGAGSFFDHHDDTTPTDPTGTPSHGFPHGYHPVRHPATTGEPNRGDELLFIDTEITRAAATGILDHGNHHLLDNIIEGRRQQWHTEIDAAARRRHHLTDGLIATATYYHHQAQHDLTTARLALIATTTENNHWRHHLTGPLTTRGPGLSTDPHNNPDTPRT